MKFKSLIITTITCLMLTANIQANDINSSWDVRTLKAQAYSQMVKNAQKKKFRKHISKITQDNHDSENPKAISLRMILFLIR